MSGCCSPSRGEGTDRPGAGGPPTYGGRALAWREIPGGTFLMGDDSAHAVPGDGEGPVRPVAIEAFALAAHTVTTSQFAAFVHATGHVTDAEHFGWSFAFAGHLSPTTAQTATEWPVGTPWWRVVEGADWRHPEGPDSDLSQRADHPVVHVSQRDALAFCTWAGARLPNEAEWERAARGGLERQPFPWGAELAPDDVWRCNVWQGSFPDEDTVEDGHRGTAPVDAFAPNAYGLHNVIGNVWEWTASPWDTSAQAAVMRGGSFMCHASYCNRYRTSARSPVTPDSSTANLGFRCARPAAVGARPS